MIYVRHKHIITSINEVDGVNRTTHDYVFPSINQAKRYNRTKLAGQATVVASRPKLSKVHTVDNMTCSKE